MSELDCGCPARYLCRHCREVVCMPHDINQPDCEHGFDLCAECRGECRECRADRIDDERGAA